MPELPLRPAALAAAALLALLLAPDPRALAGSASAQAGLFLDVPAADDARLAAGPTVLRGRVVDVDWVQLGEPGRPAGAAGPSELLTLNLFPDAVYAAALDRIEPTSSGQGYVWIGRVRDAGPSQVTLIVEDGVLVGNLRVPGGSYEVRYLANGLHAVYQINPAAFPPD